MKILGIDVGGSGIKGAVVDINKGELVTERYRIPTPQPATPESITDTIKKIADYFQWNGKIGVGFPAVVINGVVKTASNIDKSCVNVDFEKLIQNKTGCNAKVLNDADAAAIAEIEFGEGKNMDGVVLMLTIGTGIGSAVFYNGVLIPNTELGHVYLKNCILAEHYTSDATRKQEDLSWEKWAKRFDKYLKLIELLINPNYIIIGGGVSKKMHKYKEFLKTRAEIRAASFLNHSGIIGSAKAAEFL